ncbi:helix-turn-helix transcriptional regulator [Streptomyces sp. NPDC001514]
MSPPPASISAIEAPTTLLPLFERLRLVCLTGTPASFPVGRARIRLREEAPSYIRRRQAERSNERRLNPIRADVWLGLAKETPTGAPEPAPAARGSVLSALTEAELRLAQLVGQEAGNQEAAAKLYLSVKTVEARLTRIYQKPDVRSRAQPASALGA